MGKNTVDKFHVVAVNVAADLAVASELASFISLEAMNAKVLVSRSGRQALGFQPITDFMAEMSDKVIDLVSAVNIDAMAISKLSTQCIRSVHFKHQLDKALELSDQAAHQKDIIAFQMKADISHKILFSTLVKSTGALIDLLDEIISNMQAAFIMATTARIETAALKVSNQDTFYSVSDKLEDAARKIHACASQDKTMLILALKREGVTL